jgi:hypothetical protein
MFSLDQWVANPPLSVILSLLLILGLDRIGIIFLKQMSFAVDSSSDWVRWQGPTVGAMVLAISIYPLALAGFTPPRLMQCIALVCISLGCWNLIQSGLLEYGHGVRWIEGWRWLMKQSLSSKLLLVMLLGMGLLALGPVTNADALDYHMGVAIALLNNGGMPVSPEWFIGRLAGNGELLNALALSVGAEQFGSLLQYVSLLSIVGLVLFAGPRVPVQTDEKHGAATGMIALAAFSAPVLLFLISAPKPQLWPIAMTTFAFALLVHPTRRSLSRRDALLGFAMICALVMTASQAKFNYLLGGGLVGLFALSTMVQKRLFWSAAGVGIGIAAFVIVPSILWKVTVFHADWIEALIHPLPGHFPGTNKFIDLAKGAADMASPLPFPLLMLIPTSLGAFSTLLGIGAVVLVGLRPGQDKLLWAGIAAAVGMVMASAVLAPPSSRMYLEPYFWLMVSLTVQPSRAALAKMRWVHWAVYLQALAVALAGWLGALTLFPGALKLAWRTEVMQRAANGYEVMRWADTVLPKNAVLLNGHRSMALVPRDAVAYDWSNYVDITADESRLYLNRLKDRGVTHMLLVGQIDKGLPLSNCFGKTIAGPGLGHLATRNPFNQGGTYEAWIVEFESTRLPQCAQNVAPKN